MDNNKALVSKAMSLLAQRRIRKEGEKAMRERMSRMGKLSGEVRRKDKKVTNTLPIA